MNPSWRYHATKEPKLVKSVAEDKALGSEWADTPAAFDPASPAFRGAVVTPLKPVQPAPMPAPKPLAASPAAPKMPGRPRGPRKNAAKAEEVHA